MTARHFRARADISHTSFVRRCVFQSIPKIDRYIFRLVITPMLGVFALAATLLLVAREDRRRARTPFWLLIFYLLFAGVLAFIPRHHHAEKRVSGPVALDDAQVGVGLAPAERAARGRDLALADMHRQVGDQRFPAAGVPARSTERVFPSIDRNAEAQHELGAVFGRRDPQRHGAGATHPVGRTQRCGRVAVRGRHTLADVEVHDAGGERALAGGEPLSLDLDPTAARRSDRGI